MAQPAKTLRTVVAIGVSGLVAAAAEMAIVLPIQARLGVSPTRVFQFIGAGAIGRAAFHGQAGVALGVAAHLLISVGAAAVFVLAGQRWPALVRRPVLSGGLFGVLAFAVMTFVVMPLSRIGFQPPKSLALGALSLATHVIAFGIPLALAAAACLRIGGRTRPDSSAAAHA